LEIADHFEISVRTVQRRIRNIRSNYSGVEVREEWDGSKKTYRCIRYSVSDRLKPASIDVITLHRLRLASEVFRHSGLTAHADAMDAHIETLMLNLPRVVRQTYERDLERLSKLERVKIARTVPVADKGVVEALQLASLAHRKMSVVLDDGQTLKGTVKALTYDLGQDAEVAFHSEKGTISVPLRSVQKINGIDDLLADAMLQC
jgi:predicted DNA-binding transcriptional regulator YafY